MSVRDPILFVEDRRKKSKSAYLLVVIHLDMALLGTMCNVKSCHLIVVLNLLNAFDCHREILLNVKNHFHVVLIILIHQIMKGTTLMRSTLLRVNRLPTYCRQLEQFI